MQQPLEGANGEKNRREHGAVRTHEHRRNAAAWRNAAAFGGEGADDGDEVENEAWPAAMARGEVQPQLGRGEAQDHGLASSQSGGLLL